MSAVAPQQYCSEYVSRSNPHASTNTIVDQSVPVGQARSIHFFVLSRRWYWKVDLCLSGDLFLSFGKTSVFQFDVSKFVASFCCEIIFNANCLPPLPICIECKKMFWHTAKTTTESSIVSLPYA
jgi:hypothetical protein